MRQARWWGALALCFVPVLLPLAGSLSEAAAFAWSADSLAGGARLLPDTRQAKLLLDGIGLSIAAALVASCIGFAVAAACMLPAGRLPRTVLAAAALGSLCLGSVVHLMAWRIWMPDAASAASGAWSAGAWILASRYAPVAALFLVAALASCDRSEFETASTSAGPLGLLRFVCRRLRTAWLHAVVAVAALAFAEAEVPGLLGLHTYAEEFLGQVAIESSSAASMAFGWPMVAIALLAALVLAWGLRLGRATGATAGNWFGAWARPPAAMRMAAGTACLLLAWPVLTLCAQAARLPALPSSAAPALATSLAVAALAAALAVAWALAIAECAVRAGPPAVRGVLAALPLLLLWPSAMLGLWIAGWPHPAWLPAWGPMIAAHLLRVLPAALLIVLLARASSPPAEQEQEQVTGIPWHRGWPRLHWPRLRAPALAAFALGAGLSCSELTVTVLTVPPGTETIVLRMYNLLHYGDRQAVIVLAALQAALVCALALLGGLAVFRTARSPRG
ncbi:MAG: hypothetical protein EPO01_06560 [Aquabacterium sp.]|nr:MAG: hypothetical protein EPO01_06560 [Aquabacterium sp.]